MTYTKEKRNAYQKEFIKKRRTSWFQENGPCVICGSWKNLEIDHIDPSAKSTNIDWSWSESRRNKELKKCQVLCHCCHKKKTSAYMSKILSGENAPCAKLTNEKVRKIRFLHRDGWLMEDIANLMQVTGANISMIVNRKTWKHI